MTNSKPISHLSKLSYDLSGNSNYMDTEFYSNRSSSFPLPVGLVTFFWSIKSSSFIIFVKKYILQLFSLESQDIHQQHGYMTWLWWRWRDHGGYKPFPTKATGGLFPAVDVIHTPLMMMMMMIAPHFISIVSIFLIFRSCLLIPPYNALAMHDQAAGIHHDQSKFNF